MRENWKGPSPHATDLMVVSRKQYNQTEFRNELIQRHEMSEKMKKRARPDRSSNRYDKKERFEGQREWKNRDRRLSSNNWGRKEAGED